MKAISPSLRQTVLDIAAEIKTAHPDINNISGRMVKDYINISRDKSEERIDLMFVHAYYIDVVLSENGYAKHPGQVPNLAKGLYY